MSFQTQIEIRGYHCDAYGHLNNARYLELFEEARWRALQESGLMKLTHEENILFYIVNINLTFRKPVKNNQLITVNTRLSDIDRRYISFHQTMMDDEQTKCAEAKIKFVLFDEHENKSISIDSNLKLRFNVFV